MSFLTFRNGFLSEVEARLAIFNIGEASDNDLLAKGALFKMAANIGELDLLNPSSLKLLDGMTGAELNTWLNDSSNSEAFQRILTDSTALNALIVSGNLTAIMASSKALSLIIESQVALNSLAANESGWTIFKNATGLTSVSIPTMTDYNLPSGDTSQSSLASGSNQAYHAFDKNHGTYWLSSSGASGSQYIQYDFDVPVFIHTLKTNTKYNGANSYPTSASLQYSDDEETWNLAVSPNIDRDYTDDFRESQVTSVGKHRYWRLTMHTTGGSSQFSVNEMDLVGFQ